MSEIKDFLKSFEMFSGLSDEMLNKVGGYCKETTCQPGSIIIERNSPADHFYLIREGTVEILAGGQTEVVVVTLGRGQSFGEMGLVDSGTRSATVRAATKAELFEIDCSSFREMFETDTDLGYQVMRNIATDLSFKLRYRNLL